MDNIPPIAWDVVGQLMDNIPAAGNRQDEDVVGKLMDNIPEFGNWPVAAAVFEIMGRNCILGSYFVPADRVWVKKLGRKQRNPIPDGMLSVNKWTTEMKLVEPWIRNRNFSKI